MTFTEAAVDVLRREGKPLHFRKIAEIAIRENLLDHVGKIPEDTMADQLASHCRLPRPERNIIVVQAGTFALEEWGLAEDPAGLENLVEAPPEGEPPYRPKERHPIPSRELARGGGRESGRGRRREEGEEKRRRFPPPAEVAYEILAGAERPLSPGELAALGAERLLMPDAFVREPQSLVAALREDNRRRESAGRRPLFEVQGDTVTLAAQPEPGERPAPVAAARAPAGPAEMRRVALAALRRRLRECDAPTVEWLAGRLLEKMGLAEVKVAKRGREHVVFTGRRRLGLVDVRHCARVVRTGAEVGRRDVVEVRRDLGHYGAQIGMLLTTGEAAREARGEAGAAGQMPVLLLAGEAFAEAFAEAGVACRQVLVPEVDESFLAQAAELAQKEEAVRRARREERDRREEREGGGAGPGDDREGSRGEREGRGERDGRREGREGRDRRDRRDERRGEEREKSAVRPEPEDAERLAALAAAGPSVEGGTAPGGLPAESPPGRPEPADVADLPLDADEGDDVDEGDDGEGEAEPGSLEDAAGGAQPGGPVAAGAEGAAGEGRRRRRRRRRRGGRGRGERRPGGEGPPREGASPEGGAAASPPGTGGSPVPEMGSTGPPLLPAPPPSEPAPAAPEPAGLLPPAAARSGGETE